MRRNMKQGLFLFSLWVLVLVLGLVFLPEARAEDELNLDHLKGIGEFGFESNSLSGAVIGRATVELNGDISFREVTLNGVSIPVASTTLDVVKSLLSDPSVTRTIKIGTVRGTGSDSIFHESQFNSKTHKFGPITSTPTSELFSDYNLSGRVNNFTVDSKGNVSGPTKTAQEFVNDLDYAFVTGLTPVHSNLIPRDISIDRQRLTVPLVTGDKISMTTEMPTNGPSSAIRILEVTTPTGTQITGRSDLVSEPFRTISTETKNKGSAGVGIGVSILTDTLSPTGPTGNLVSLVPDNSNSAIGDGFSVVAINDNPLPKGHSIFVSATEADKIFNGGEGMIYVTDDKGHRTEKVFGSVTPITDIGMGRPISSATAITSVTVNPNNRKERWAHTITPIRHGDPSFGTAIEMQPMGNRSRNFLGSLPQGTRIQIDPRDIAGFRHSGLTVDNDGWLDVDKFIERFGKWDPNTLGSVISVMNPKTQEAFMGRDKTKNTR